MQRQALEGHAGHVAVLEGYQAPEGVLGCVSPCILQVVSDVREIAGELGVGVDGHFEGCLAKGQCYLEGSAGFIKYVKNVQMFLPSWPELVLLGMPPGFVRGTLPPPSRADSPTLLTNNQKNQKTRNPREPQSL